MTVGESIEESKPSIHLSLAGADMDVSDALSAAEAAGAESLAIPGSWLEDGVFEEAEERLRRFEVLEAADIAPSSVSSNVPGQTPAIVDAFVEKMSTMLERAARIGAESVTLSLGEPRIAGESGSWEAKVGLLKRVAPFLRRNGVNLRLPLRIPRVGGGSSLAEWAALVRESMSPDIGIELRIHPHESGGGTPPEGLEGAFLLLVGSASFVFEPEMGNSLSPKLLRQWFDAFDAPVFDGAVFARPRVTSMAALESALSALKGPFALM